MSTEQGNRPESPKTEPATIRPGALHQAVSRLLGVPVQYAEYQAEPLHGGTLGDVKRFTGEATTADRQTLPFRIVLKTQKRWERPGDPHSWRREYDLFHSALSHAFTPAFRAPRIYFTEIDESANQLWMESVDGVSGTRLTVEELACAARELGRFQGRCHQREQALRSITCLGDAGYVQRDFAQWTPDTVEYRWLRSAECTLPVPLRQLLIDTQNRAETIYSTMQALPQVLCHRDYWTENIFVQSGGVIAIDWDTTGWGAAGEDIASLIADETDAAQIGAYFARLVPAYCQGLAETMELPPQNTFPIREMILLKFGYRFLQQVLFSPSPAQKAQAILALEQVAALPPVAGY